jgi:hypothetical protein
METIIYYLQKLSLYTNENILVIKKFEKPRGYKNITTSEYN